MESRENPLFGRKIFFVCPSFGMEKYLIEYLKKNEYEIYIIKEIRKLKHVLSEFPDAMCFINIDSEYTYSQWFNFMRSVTESDMLKSIYLGILTEQNDWEAKDKFLMNVKLPGGFTVFKKDERAFSTFAQILDLNGAKGRRKYLRLVTSGARDVSGYMAHEGKLYSFDFKDISSAGFAITYKKDMCNLFQKNTLVRNLCISVGNKSMVCSCIVFNTQINQDGSAMSVLMLTNENPESTRTYIQNYIHSKNELKMREVINKAENDTDSYKEPDEYSKLKAVRDRNYDDMEVLAGIDSLDNPDSLDAGPENPLAGRDLDSDIL